jgi:hypothetical protein
MYIIACTLSDFRSCQVFSNLIKVLPKFKFFSFFASKLVSQNKIIIR